MKIEEGHPKTAWSRMPFACCEPSCAGQRPRAWLMLWVKLPDGTVLVVRGPRRSLVRRGVWHSVRRLLAGLSMRSSSNTEREHQEGPVPFDENDAAVLGTVVGHEADTARRLGDLGDPLGHGTETRPALVDGSEDSVDQRVPDAVHDLEGQRASVTTAMSVPAAAAATPFLRESLSSTLEKNEEDGVESELVVFWLSRDMMTSGKKKSRRENADGRLVNGLRLRLDARRGPRWPPSTALDRKVQERERT